jgi:carbonic anhydrase
VVRTAGHVLDDAVLGSLEYSVSVLNVPLIVVLGHDNCGAVTATKAAVETGVMPRVSSGIWSNASPRQC